MPQKPPNKQQMRMIIKRQLDMEEYTRLLQFVYLEKPFKSEIPGKYSIYYMYGKGMIIATSEPCINEWLEEQGLPKRNALSEWTINAAEKNNLNKGKSAVKPKRINQKPGLENDVWHWYTANVPIREIASRLKCSPGNVFYYVRKYKQNNPDWAEEMEENG